MSRIMRTSFTSLQDKLNAMVKMKAIDGARYLRIVPLDLHGNCARLGFAEFEQHGDKCDWITGWTSLEECDRALDVLMQHGLAYRALMERKASVNRIERAAGRIAAAPTKAKLLDELKRFGAEEGRPKITPEQRAENRRNKQRAIDDRANRIGQPSGKFATWRDIQNAEKSFRDLVKEFDGPPAKAAAALKRQLRQASMPLVVDSNSRVAKIRTGSK